jgi:hypothetical protein
MPDSRPERGVPWYIAEGLDPTEWPGRDERQRVLRELLGLLRDARQQAADWYTAALGDRRSR